ncbi:MAG: hypothetical protein SGJ27_09455 [Candidatus Melainabacteria bacterium]|nr:hypothetical protein [Candidatus Melainabacteria bacterium]
MSRKKIALTATTLALVACVALVALYKTSTSREWPDFLTDKQGAPKYNTEVAKRDFGYRTGNHVPVGLYFKLAPGMELLTDQTVINGDFQVVSQQEYREKSGEDTLVRIDLTLQTFVLKPKLEVKPTIAYRTKPGDDVKKLDLLPIEVYSSQTYDGRKSEHPKESADITFVSDNHLTVTGALVVLGALGVVLAIGGLLRNRKPRVKREKKSKTKTEAASGPFPAGWEPVQSAWAAITGGDRSKPAFAKAAASLRSFFGVDTLTVSELKRSTVPNKDQLTAFLTRCEKALWTNNDVLDEEVEAANAVMVEIEASLLPAPASPLATK